nr:dephospho-CoA kinase [Pelagibacterium limicola]
MLRVGLTGSMATGKTTVLNAVADLGIPTHSADEAVHALYAGEAAPLIETAFPGTTAGGVVDRAALAAVLADQPERLGELESLIHPLVREMAMAFFDAAEAAGADMAVVEVPLLFETGALYGLDKVIVTACDPEIQRVRALARPGMTGEKFAFLLSRQLDQDEKRKRADVVIDTSGTMEETVARTKAAIASLRAGNGE